jgi:hypothetical protein
VIWAGLVKPEEAVVVVVVDWRLLAGGGDILPIRIQLQLLLLRTIGEVLLEVSIVVDLGEVVE